MEKVKLKVEGIECMGCVKRIENVLSQIKGIQHYQVSLDEKTVQLETESQEVIKDVIAHLENIDFQAKIEE